MEASELKLLSELLNPKSVNDSDQDDICTTDDCLTPSQLTAKATTKSNYKSPYAKTADKAEEMQQAFRRVDNEEAESLFYGTSGDSASWKQTPQWDISYRQSVTSSDVFLQESLQMSAKNPSTASCEDMVLKVSLPGESRQNVNLKVEASALDVESPKFKLTIPLPQPVDPQLGNAEFDPDSQLLTIILKMRREFDYINF